MDAKRFLFISYTFPPVGGAGVQRPAKFVKYLAAAGWRPEVLTASNPSVPTTDETLAAEVANVARVHRTKTLEPGYAAKRAVTSSHRNGFSLKRLARRTAAGLLQPDPQLMWLPTAVPAGIRLVRQHQLQAVVVSGPPFSSFLAAALVSRRTGVPLVVDYRDEWSISSRYWENRARGPVSDRVQQQLERFVLRSASVVIATTQRSAESLAWACQEAGSRARVEHIYNGFDPMDFDAPAPPPRASRFVLTYTGTLWNLTSIEPLVRATQQLVDADPTVRDRFELVVAGRVTDAQLPWLERFKATGVSLHQLDYVSHDRAIELMRQSSALCVLLSGVPGAERVVPAKIFEYLAASRPILAIAPHGETTTILSEAPRAHCADPADVNAIVEWLKTGIAGSLRTGGDAPRLEQYRRDVQARALGALLDWAINAEVGEHVMAPATPQFGERHV